MSNSFTKLAVRYTVAYSLATGVLLAVVLLAVFRVHPGIGLVAGARSSGSATG